MVSESEKGSNGLKTADDSGNRNRETLRSARGVLRRLVGAHLVLSTVPALMAWGTPGIQAETVAWMFVAVLVGQVVLLGFWVGMGTRKASARIEAALLGAGYLAIWPMVCWTPWNYSPSSTIRQVMGWYFGMVFYNVVSIVLIAEFFSLLRRWWDLRWTGNSGETGATARFQYSILHLLVIASVTAVMLGLTCVAWPKGDEPRSDGSIIASCILILLAFPINSFCAAKAALRTGPVGLPVALAFLVASLSGIAVSLSTRQDQLAWRLIASDALMVVIPTAIVVGSLLVVRRCGYRLVPKE